MSENRLVLVSTPIGNLEDISDRAFKALESCDCIVAEDTRSTKDLLKLLGVPFAEKTFVPFHEHNQDKVESILSSLENFKLICVVSDAGSPVLSDPAYPLIYAALEKGFDVTSIPGPSAITTALELSGLPPIPYTFLGFLPRKEQARRSLFDQCSDPKTYIGFESPQRVSGLIDCLVECYEDVDIVLARELTKKFESILRFKGKDWQNAKSELITRGEFVVLWRPLLEDENKSSGTSQEVLALADGYLKKPSPKNLSKLLSKITGQSVQDLYNHLNKK